VLILLKEPKGIDMVEEVLGWKVDLEREKSGTSSPSLLKEARKKRTIDKGKTRRGGPWLIFRRGRC